MAYTGYINKEVAKMYGIPYSQLTAEQKKILHDDSVRRAKLIKEREEAVLRNNLKAFEDEAKMERVLASIYRDCQKQILADVTETISKVKKAGGEWSYANQSALTRSRGLFEQISKELTKLGQKEQILFTQGLGNIYTDQFLRQVYELGQSIPVKANFNRLNSSLIRKTLDYPWSGAMFSDRLWNDKEILGRNLRVGLTQSMILGESIPKITERINKNINTSKYNAERVARTETKRVTYCAHNDAYTDMGVEELEYRCANGGDSRTCSYCHSDNGKRFKRGEEPTLPRHPNCRCVYIPVVSDEFGDNELNELTGSVRGAENYEKWRAEQEKQKAQTVITRSTSSNAKYDSELDRLDVEYKAQNLKISTMQAEYDDLETQSRGYATIRRGFQEPEEAGFASRADFEAVDKALTKQMRELQDRIAEAQEDLKDIARDRQFLLKVGADRVDNLEDYEAIRQVLRNTKTFDYVNYGDELLDTLAKMDASELTLQRQLYKNGSVADWRGLSPATVFKDGAISDVRLLAQTSKVSYNNVEKLAEALTEDDIIEKLAGGDMTDGSCSSLGFAYIGNRNGLDVTDFRGGNSQEFFANYPHIKAVLNLPNVKGKVIKVKKEAGDTAKIIKALEYGKEYYLAVGKHASIIKNTQEGVMYLELQSSRENGWMPFDRYGSIITTLQKRFGCRKTEDKIKLGIGKTVTFERDVVLMEVDSFKDNAEFQKLLGYINTATDKQKKGVSGSVK